LPLGVGGADEVQAEGEGELIDPLEVVYKYQHRPTKPEQRPVRGLEHPQGLERTIIRRRRSEECHLQPWSRAGDFDKRPKQIPGGRQCHLRPGLVSDDA
jgi:hypothetical protein